MPALRLAPSEVISPMLYSFAVLHQRMTLPITSISLAGSKGLTSQPVAPAARPACFIWSLDSVVRIRIGVVLNLGLSRSFLVRLMPSMRGMFWSVSTRSKSRLLDFSQASCPSTASTTLKPAFLSVKETIWRIEAESSTARIECIVISPGIKLISVDFSNSLEQFDRTGVHFVLRDRVRPQRGDLHDRLAVLVVAEGVAGELVGAVARPLARMGDQLGGHVLELQRGDGAGDVVHHAVQRRAVAALLGGLAQLGLDLRGGGVEMRRQRLARVVEQALQALKIVVHRHQVILELGRHQQRDHPVLFGRV